MKKNKNKLLIIIAFIFGLILVGIASYFVISNMQSNIHVDKSNKTVNEINNNSVLPYKIYSSFKDFDNDTMKNKYNYLKNYTTYDFHSKNNDLSFYFSKCDEKGDNSCLTSMDFTSKDYSIFDIKVGDNIPKAIKKLLENEYLKGESYDGFYGTYYSYLKNDVAIGLLPKQFLDDEGSEIISSIYIQAPSNYSVGNDVLY